MQADREFTEEDRQHINPCRSLSIAAAMQLVANPVRCCAHVHALIQQLVRIVLAKKDDPKTKGERCTRADYVENKNYNKSICLLDSYY